MVVADAVEGSIVVAAGVDEVMDVIADFDAYPEWQDEVREVEILASDDDGWGTRVRFVVEAKVIKATLVLDYTYTERTMSWVLVEGVGVRRNDGSYVCTDLGDGTTRVTYSLEVDPAVPVPGVIKRQAAKRIVHGALEGMKRRVEFRA